MSSPGLLPSAAYLAGLVDGEGYIGIIRMGGRQRACLTPVLRIGMTHFPTLEALKVNWGGGVYSRRIVKNGRRPSATWQVQGQMAVNLLAMVWPFLQTKRTQAWLVFQFWVERTRTRHGYRISDDEAALREGYKLALQTANQEGL